MRENEEGKRGGKREREGMEIPREEQPVGDNGVIPP